MKMFSKSNSNPRYFNCNYTKVYLAFNFTGNHLMNSMFVLSVVSFGNKILFKVNTIVLFLSDN